MSNYTYHRAADYRQPEDFLPYSCRDIESSLDALFLARAGVKKSDDPIVEHLVAEDVGLAKLARHWLAPHFDRDSLRAAPPAEIIQRALGTDDFVTALTSGWGRVVQSTFNAAVSGYRSLLREIPVQNFQPQHIPSFSGFTDLVELPEHGQWSYGALSASRVLEDVSVTSYGLRFTVSRQALVNDASEEITAVMQQLGNIAALHVAKSVATTLEDTATLDDGSAFFATNNLLSGGSAGAPSVSIFDAAAAKLWRQPVGSHISGTAPRFIVVPPELQGTARALAAAMFDPSGSPGTLPQGRMDVVVLPHLSSTTYWYLMGDPTLAPALGLLRLSGSPEIAVVERVRAPMQDGITFQLLIDYRIARISRTGAVKVAP